MFILFYLTTIYILGSLKNYNRKYTAMSPLQRAVNEYNLLIIELFTVDKTIYREQQ